jgi:hypothetical protein
LKVCRELLDHVNWATTPDSSVTNIQDRTSPLLGILWRRSMLAISTFDTTTMLNTMRIRRSLMRGVLVGEDQWFTEHAAPPADVAGRALDPRPHYFSEYQKE